MTENLIDEKKIEDVLAACKYYKHKDSIAALHESLLEFIDSSLSELDNSLYISYRGRKGGIIEENMPGESFISRAFGRKKGPISKIGFERFDLLLDRYLERHNMDISGAYEPESRYGAHLFSKDTRITLSERVNNWCSNPVCTNATCGPDPFDSTKSKKRGVAFAIQVPFPHSARYNKSLKPQQFGSISNGIWLCDSCASDVFEDTGGNYTVALLLNWKNETEKLMSFAMKGRVKITLGLLPEDNQLQTCRSIIRFLDPRIIPFAGTMNDRDGRHKLIKEIRVFLAQILKETMPFSPLDTIVDSIDRACKYYLTRARKPATESELTCSFGTVRKIIGMNMLGLTQCYGVKLTKNVRTIVPKY